MNKREQRIRAMKDFVKVAREKKYSESMIMNIGIICGSSQMREQGYGVIEAFNKAKDYVVEGKTAGETVDELIKLTGYEE